MKLALISVVLLPARSLKEHGTDIEQTGANSV